MFDDSSEDAQPDDFIDFSAAGYADTAEDYGGPARSGAPGAYGGMTDTAERPEAGAPPRAASYGSYNQSAARRYPMQDGPAASQAQPQTAPVHGDARRYPPHASEGVSFQGTRHPMQGGYAANRTPGQGASGQSGYYPPQTQSQTQPAPGDAAPARFAPIQPAARRYPMQTQNQAQNRPQAAPAQAPAQPASQDVPGTAEEKRAQADSAAFINSVFSGAPRPAAPARTTPQTPSASAQPPQAARSPQTAAPQQAPQAAQPSSAVGSIFAVPERQAGWTYDLQNPSMNDVFGALAGTEADPRLQREEKREQKIEERREQMRNRARDDSRPGHRGAKMNKRDGAGADAGAIRGCGVRAKNLTKSFGDHTVWSGLTFKIEPGDMVALTGPSGSGKSTLLNCMGLLDAPTSGRLAVDGEDVTKIRGRAARLFHRDRVGYLFQDYALVDNESVASNIRVAMDGIPRGKRRQALSDALESVGLSGREGQMVRTLSGGEQQRVALARLLVRKPGLILADEPTGSLDPGNEMTIILALRQLADQGATVVIATHSGEVAGACDRAIDLTRHE